MEQVKYIQSTQCSDWGRTWGLGTNKLGKLRRTDNEVYPYEWKGMAEGRHNQVLRKTWTVMFNYKADTKELIMHPENKYNSLPDMRDVLAAIEILNKPLPVKLPRKYNTRTMRPLSDFSKQQLQIF